MDHFKTASFITLMIAVLWQCPLVLLIYCQKILKYGFSVMVAVEFGG
jgi:hypothetical protein